MNENNIRSGIYETYNTPLQQQQFVLNNSKYQPNSTFYNPQIVAPYGENMRDMSQYNMSESFRKITPLTQNQDFNYKENTLYANLNSNLLSETLTEYRLNIDSIDRNVEIYPDPFNYKVFFGPITNSGGFQPNILNNNVPELKFNTEEEVKIYNAFPHIIAKYDNIIKNQYNPYILRDFKNVKFIRLDNVIMPRFNKLIINCEWDELTKCKKKHLKDDFEKYYECVISKYRYIPDLDECNALFFDRFIMIEIDELTDYKNLATNSINNKAFTVFSDKYISPLYYKATGYYSIRNYIDSALGNISCLSFKFYNSWGEPITLNRTSIQYETKFIQNTHFLNPNINCDEYFKFCVLRMTEIIKCIVLINYKICKKINFYEDDIIFNQTTFDVSKDTIFEELNDFVSKEKTFIDVYKKTQKNTKTKISINDYINNVFWYDLIDVKEVKYNFKILFDRYKKYIYDLLVNLKIEIDNIPLNKCFQNHLMMVISCATNDLNTKIAYHSN